MPKWLGIGINCRKKRTDNRVENPVDRRKWMKYLKRFAAPEKNSGRLLIIVVIVVALFLGSSCFYTVAVDEVGCGATIWKVCEDGPAGTQL